MSGTVGSGRVPPTPLLRASSGGPPQASPRMGGESEPTTWSLQCYRSRGVLEDGAHLRLYFLQAGGGRGGSQWPLWVLTQLFPPSFVCSAPSSSTPTQRPARRISPSSPTRASWRAGRQSRRALSAEACGVTWQPLALPVRPPRRCPSSRRCSPRRRSARRWARAASARRPSRCAAFPPVLYCSLCRPHLLVVVVVPGAQPDGDERGRGRGRLGRARGRRGEEEKQES